MAYWLYSVAGHFASKAFHSFTDHISSKSSLQYRCLRNKSPSQSHEFIGVGAMDVTKPYKIIGFGTIQGPKPYKCVGLRWVISQTPVSRPGRGYGNASARGRTLVGPMSLSFSSVRWVFFVLRVVFVGPHLNLVKNILKPQLTSA